MLYLLLPNAVSGYRMKLTWGRDIHVPRWYITSGLVSELTSVVASSVIMWPLIILLSLGCRAWSLECIQLLLLMSMDFTLAFSHKNLTPYLPSISLQGVILLITSLCSTYEWCWAGVGVGVEERWQDFFFAFTTTPKWDFTQGHSV